MSRAPNLARQPFINRRPVVRAATLLAIAAIVLLGLNAWLYWQHFSGRGAQRTELEELAASSAEETARLEEALGALERFDLDWQEDQINFLNARIAERTFAWSALFDDLAEVLPRSVRIERVTPRLLEADSRRRGVTRSAADEVALELTGAAEEDEALLELLDAFFAHERFRRPSLKVEAREAQSRQVGYSMSVIYVPTLPGAPAPEEKPGDADEPLEAVTEDGPEREGADVEGVASDAEVEA